MGVGIFIGSGLLFLLAYRWHGGFLARVFDLDDRREVPAISILGSVSGVLLLLAAFIVVEATRSVALARPQ